MLNFLSVVTLSLLAVANALPASERWDRPLVDLGYATYHGIYNETADIQSFKGIRYPAPPTGDLRWSAPSPLLRCRALEMHPTMGYMCVALRGPVAANHGFVSNLIRGLPFRQRLPSSQSYSRGRLSACCRLDSWRRLYHWFGGSYSWVGSDPASTGADPLHIVSRQPVCPIER